VLETRDGVILVGTAHILASSVREVEQTIRTVRPSRVLVELDPARLKALRDPEAWQNTDVFQVIRQKKQHLFLLQLYLASMQAQMGRETGVPPGTDMLRAVQVAEEVGAEVVLIDRDIAVTLRRGFGGMGLWARLRLFWKVWMELLTPTDPEAPPPNLDEILRSDAITEMTEQFAQFAPSVKTALIDERDEFMASHVREQAAKTKAEGGTLVAVVGAGHLKGMGRWMDHPEEIPPRERLLTPPPKRFPWGTVLGLLIPIAIAAWIGWQLYQGHTEQVRGALTLWIVLHVLLAGLGAGLALGHPLAVLTGAVAAPFTSILPTGIKSGWLAGLVQAKVRTPKVKDFQGIKHVKTLGDFWRNGVVRVLTVTTLCILGSEAASILAIIFVARGIGL